MINRKTACRVNDQLDSNNGRQLLLDKKTKSSVYTHDKNFKNRRDKPEYVSRGHHPGLSGIPKASEGELVVAGVAFMVGEALKGRVPREEKSFMKLDKIYSFSLVYYSAFCWDEKFCLFNPLVILLHSF